MMAKTLRDVLKWGLWIASAVILGVCLFLLESERASVIERQLETSMGPVSIYSQAADPSGPLVVVTHGFAGSRQMMQYIARDLARAGFTVASFDFYGHGRNDTRLSPDVTRIEGTTQQLVAQTIRMTKDVRAEVGVTGPMAYLGHSMATDIIIRAAEEVQDVAAIVAISMYSEVITPSFPERLLVLSGEWEDRLRIVGREVVAQVGGEELEGQTVRNGSVVRRAVSVPGTEHVAVLFSSITMDESRAWLQAALPTAADGRTQARGLAVMAVLTALVVLIWPLARVLPATYERPEPLPIATFFAAVFLPVLPAGLACVWLGGSLMGLAAFGSLLLFFAVWGGVALIVVLRAGRRFSKPVWPAAALLILWSLGPFAFALDRYGAAFLPTGPRLELMAWLLIGSVPFAVADRLLLAGAALWQRVLARSVPVATLAGAMILFPQPLGLLFTVLPVLVLYYVVCGTMARAIANRAGPEAAAIGLAVILAWSIAASAPLFAG